MKSWEETFVATAMTLGVTLEDAVAALGDAGALRASGVVRGLRDGGRSARAHALAITIADVARQLDQMRWR
jgi:hypothetical protein